MSREIRPELAEMGRRMQSRREEHRWSQADVITRLEAVGIEMTRAAYSHWETGRADIPSSALSAIAKILKIPAAYLLGEQSTEEWQDEKAMQFYRDMAPELRPAAYAALKSLFEASDRSRTTHGRKAAEEEE